LRSSLNGLRTNLKQASAPATYPDKTHGLFIER
jgi:hypothetical protein